MRASGTAVDHPSSRKKEEKIVVIGVGNLLLKDEGVGIHVIRELQKTQLPPGVVVKDGGLAGIGLLDLFEKTSRVVLVDAADMSLEPGALRRITPDELLPAHNGPRFSSHDVGLPDVLQLAQTLDRSPQEVVIIGIQPKKIAWEADLSPEVAAAVPRAVELIQKEIKRMQDAA